MEEIDGGSISSAWMSCLFGHREEDISVQHTGKDTIQRNIHLFCSILFTWRGIKILGLPSYNNVACFVKHTFYSQDVEQPLTQEIHMITMLEHIFSPQLKHWFCFQIDFSSSRGRIFCNTSDIISPISSSFYTKTTNLNELI